MSMVTAWIPSVWITSSAWSRLSGEDVRYGIRTPITFSLPSASTARNAVSDESTPPESPTIPLVNPRRRTTSSLRNDTSHRRAKSASICSGSPSSTPRPTTWILGAGSGEPGAEPLVAGSNSTVRASRFPFPEVFDQMRQIDLKVGQQGSFRSRARDLLEVDIVGQHRFLEQGPSHHRSEEHTSELQSRFDLVCRLLLEKKKQ